MADINSIIAKEALDEVEKLDRLITSVDDGILKLISHGKSLDAFAKGIGSVKELTSAQKELNSVINESQKISRNNNTVNKEAEKTKKKLAEADAKLAAKQKEHNDALALEVKTVGDAIRQNKALTIERNKTATSLGKQSQEVKELNAKLQQNTEFIRANGTAAEKQRMNIGNYGSALQGIGKFATMAAGALGITGGLAGAFAVVRSAVASSQTVSDNWKVTTAGLSNAWGEFLNSLANWDWSGFLGRLADANKAGRDYAETLDLLEKRSAGLTTKHKEEDEAIAKLRLSYYDHNKTAAEKAAIMQQAIELTQKQSDEDAALAEQAYKDYQQTILHAKGISDAEMVAYLKFNKTTEEKVKLVERYNNLERASRNKLLTLDKNAFQEYVNLKVMGVDKVAKLENKLSDEQIDKARTLYNAVLDANKAKFENKEGLFRKMENQEKKSESAELKAINAQKTKYEQAQEELDTLTKKFQDLKIANQPVPQDLLQSIVDKQNQLKEIEKSTENIALNLIAMQMRGQDVGAMQSKGIGTVKSDKTGGIIDRLFDKRSGSTAAANAADVTARGENPNAWGMDQSIEAAQTSSDAIFQIISQRDQAAFDNKMNLLEKEKEAKLKNAKLTEKQRERIEADYAKKQAKLREEQFRKEKAASIIQAIINTALAVSKAAGNPAQMILAGLVGAAQVAVIAAQPVPEFDAGIMSTPSTFKVAERRPEWMRMPSGQWRYMVRPTMFKNMPGATIIGGEQTERLRKAGLKPTDIDIRPDIERMESNIVGAIINRRELSISASGSKITEREGSYYKTYFNRKIQWAGRKNS